MSLSPLYNDRGGRRWILAAVTGLWMLMAGGSGAANPLGREVGAEFFKIEIKFHSETSGLIWAYRCETCLPKRLIFDQRLWVRGLNDPDKEYRLEDVHGKPALVTWIENTAQALQVRPMEIVSE